MSFTAFKQRWNSLPWPVRGVITKALPLVILGLIMVGFVPWNDLASLSQRATIGIFGGCLALAFMAALAVISAWDRTPSAMRDLLILILFLFAVGFFRDALNSQAGGSTYLMMTGLIWLALYTPVRFVVVGWLTYTVVFMGPMVFDLGPWYSDPTTMRANYLVFILTTILLAMMTIVLRQLRYEIKKAQAASDYHKAVVDNAGEGFLAINDKGVILDVNPRASELLGYSAEKVKGQNVTVFLQNLPEVSDLPVNGRWEGILTAHPLSKKALLLQGIMSVVEAESRTFILFLHDIRLRQRRNTLREIQYETAKKFALNKARSLTLPGVLKRIGEDGGWDGALLLSKGSQSISLLESWTRQNTPEEWQQRLNEWKSPSDDAPWVELHEQGDKCYRIESARAIQTMIQRSQLDELLMEREARLVCYSISSDDTTILVLWHQDRNHLIEDGALKDHQQHHHLLVGQTSQYLARRRAENRVRSVQALEINDDVVQQLTVAVLMHETGDHERSYQHLQRGLQGAKRIITRLARSSSQTIEPGDLVRNTSSETES